MKPPIGGFIFMSMYDQFLIFEMDNKILEV